MTSCLGIPYRPDMVAWLLAAALAAPAAPEVGCRVGSEATTAVSARDATVGPLVLIGGNRHGHHRPNAFGRKGYKVPVTLPAGTDATLEVPRSMRGRVGLVYRVDVQDRVWSRGVGAADTALRFAACPEEGRTGWPGGLVVDRPRCVTLVVRIDGQAPIRRRVPLGKPCRDDTRA